MAPPVGARICGSERLGALEAERRKGSRLRSPPSALTGWFLCTLKYVGMVLGKGRQGASARVRIRAPTEASCGQLQQVGKLLQNRG